jgi:predicted lysophospholipase L1 biosynthesis ABC-type transport system permease subunit
VIKTTYVRGAATSESRIYFRLVWGMVALGVAIILSGFNQPLVLLVISACTGGAIMFLYSFLLIVLNRNALPPAIRPTPFRVATLAWSTLFFGVLSALTIWQQREAVMRIFSGLRG